MKVERVVVTGGRNFTDGARIEADLRALVPLGLRRVAQGGARGADLCAAQAWRIVAPTFDKDSEAIYVADWQKHGKAADYRRNAEMLEAEKPDLVLAYPDPASCGTWHCVREALARGIVVALWHPNIVTDARWFDDGLREHRHCRAVQNHKPHCQRLIFASAEHPWPAGDFMSQVAAILDPLPHEHVFIDLRTSERVTT